MWTNTLNRCYRFLVPIYNVERYLQRCLDSAAAQTLENIEIICINDGSTDLSPAIIREYMERDARFVMIDKANSGYGDSMNRGLDQARGEYVGILESDDFMAPDALRLNFTCRARPRCPDRQGKLRPLLVDARGAPRAF